MQNYIFLNILFFQYIILHVILFILQTLHSTFSDELNVFNYSEIQKQLCSNFLDLCRILQIVYSTNLYSYISRIRNFL